MLPNQAIPITQTEELVLGILRAARRSLTVAQLVKLGDEFFDVASVRVQLDRMTEARLVFSSPVDRRRRYRIAPEGTAAYVWWATRRDRIIVRATSLRKAS